MRRAIELAASPDVPLWPNPRVGCVLLSKRGTVIAEGYHRGAGTPHAEADALNQAGERARGAIAIVTLEPCNHTGRTGPCAQRLIDAGVSRVLYAQSDPNPIASGGAETLRAAGIEVESGLLAEESRAVNRVWSRATELQRPYVTWKFATTLDGRSAAADGTSRWISNAAARRDTHVRRAECDVIMVGTNTVAVDDPSLTVRDADDLPAAVQPLRVVVGERALPVHAKVFDDAAPTLVMATHDPAMVLEHLWRMEKRHVFLEGGPTLAAAFAAAGLIDEIVTYVAPMLLGAGRNAVADLGISTIADALRPTVVDIAIIESADEQPCVRLVMETS
ncbi:bifunctional diaminohydroxyphosphoribosylaminopyrimidine deaminase/5-amino-6-(5-phosphoribosylamino)uracil reductase RibD [Nocardioides baekrokdamisoli]|nr:bifunctional diaminohydroxyphosphoribosylaminopyrimidine deaminase/5-amino-6-(5-phosphoribosylamino)uracil reductase RibD [Nocardioides baekrokdamisoli]